MAEFESIRASSPDQTKTSSRPTPATSLPSALKSTDRPPRRLAARTAGHGARVQSGWATASDREPWTGPRSGVIKIRRMGEDERNDVASPQQRGEVAELLNDVLPGPWREDRASSDPEVRRRPSSSGVSKMNRPGFRRDQSLHQTQGGSLSRAIMLCASHHSLATSRVGYGDDEPRPVCGHAKRRPEGAGAGPRCVEDSRGSGVDGNCHHHGQFVPELHPPRGCCGATG